MASPGQLLQRRFRPKDNISPLPGASVLTQKLIPQGESSPCTGTAVLGYFLWPSTYHWSASARVHPQLSTLSIMKSVFLTVKGHSKLCSLSWEACKHLKRKYELTF